MTPLRKRMLEELQLRNLSETTIQTYLRLVERFAKHFGESPERAGQRVMESVTQFITQNLKLKVNEAKSAVARPQDRKFLGFSFTPGPEVKRVIAPKALDRFVIIQEN